MASINFVDQTTVVPASWLNDVNALVYTVFGGTVSVPSAGKIFRSNGTAMVASTSTFADTYSINTILYAGTANTITGLATANSGVLTTNGAGVPSWTTTGLPVALGGTGATVAATGLANLGGIPLSTVTTKGDILMASGAAILARLGVGADGSRLLADSTQTTGAQWATAWFKVNSFTYDVATASGTTVITGVGFQPKAVIFVMAGNASASIQYMSIGLDDGTASVCALNSNLESANTWTLGTTGAIIADSTAGNNATGHISAFGSDGFTITWVKTGTPTGVIRVGFLALR